MQPPATHNPGFVRRAVALWTDVMIIDLWRGGAASDGGGWFEADDGRRLLTKLFLALVNGDRDSLSPRCVRGGGIGWPLDARWQHAGGLFYLHVVRDAKEAGAARVVFRGTAVVLLLVVAHPLCAGLPPGRVLLLRSRDALLRPALPGVGREGGDGRGVRDTGSLSGLTADALPARVPAMTRRVYRFCFFDAARRSASRRRYSAGGARRS